MYTVADFGRMIADRIRMNAIEESLRRSVRPSSVVLDIGTGTGICAFLACRMGARKVYAIEPNDAIQVAREIAAANGFKDRIEFTHETSKCVTLPEPADVIISDMRGVLPLHGNHLPSIIVAGKRLRAPGGVLIPQLDTLWAALVEAPEV